METINWRDAVAWPMPPQDRVVIERLRRKEGEGEDLTEPETAQAEAIIRNARRKVRDQAAERRLKRSATVEELFAELDKMKPGA